MDEGSSRYIAVEREALPPMLPAGQTTAKMMWFICCPNNDRCHHKITKKEEANFAILTALSTRRIMKNAVLYVSTENAVTTAKR